jgi:hypothetical protein
MMPASEKPQQMSSMGREMTIFSSWEMRRILEHNLLMTGPPGAGKTYAGTRCGAGPAGVSLARYPAGDVLALSI